MDARKAAPEAPLLCADPVSSTFSTMYHHHYLVYRPSIAIPSLPLLNARLRIPKSSHRSSGVGRDSREGALFATKLNRPAFGSSSPCLPSHYTPSDTLTERIIENHSVSQ